MKNENGRSMMQTSVKPIRSSFATDAIAALFIAFALLAGCTRSNASTDDVVETAVRSALSNEKDIKFDGLYETTPDLHGSSETPNYKRRFTCGYVTYRNEAGKSIRARFIYLSHSDDPSQAGQNFLSVENRLSESQPVPDAHKERIHIELALARAAVPRAGFFRGTLRLVRRLSRSVHAACALANGWLDAGPRLADRRDRTGVERRYATGHAHFRVEVVCVLVRVDDFRQLFLCILELADASLGCS